MKLTSLINQNIINSQLTELTVFGPQVLQNFRTHPHNL